MGGTNSPGSLDVEGLTAEWLKPRENAEIVVKYGLNAVTHRCILTPRQACVAPTVVKWVSGDNRGKKYTLIVTDPDAIPSREFIHWVCSDITAAALALGTIDGVDTIPYLGPRPPHSSGDHRYIFILFEQTDASAGAAEKMAAAFEGRSGKKAVTVAAAAGLTDIVALNIFQAGWDESVDAVHENMGFMPPVKYRSPAQKVKVAAAAKRHLDELITDSARLLSSYYTNIFYRNPESEIPAWLVEERDLFQQYERQPVSDDVLLKWSWTGRPIIHVLALVCAYNETMDDILLSVKSIRESVMYSHEKKNDGKRTSGHVIVQTVVVLDGMSNVHKSVWNKIDPDKRRYSLRSEFDGLKFQDNAVDVDGTFGDGTLYFVKPLNGGKRDSQLTFMKMCESCTSQPDLIYFTDAASIIDKQTVWNLIVPILEDDNVTATTGRLRVAGPSACKGLCHRTHPKENDHAHWAEWLFGTCDNDCDGSCNRARLFYNLSVAPLQAFEVELSVLLTCCMFNLVGVQPIMPGPSQMMRWSDIVEHRVVAEYTKWFGLSENNNYYGHNASIAEDRIWTALVVSKTGKEIKWCMAATVYYIPEFIVQRYIDQRRRWINGTIGAQTLILKQKVLEKGDHWRFRVARGMFTLMLWQVYSNYFAAGIISAALYNALQYAEDHNLWWMPMLMNEERSRPEIEFNLEPVIPEINVTTFPDFNDPISNDALYPMTISCIMTRNITATSDSSYEPIQTGVPFFTTLPKLITSCFLLLCTIWIIASSYIKRFPWFFGVVKQVAVLSCPLLGLPIYLAFWSSFKVAETVHIIAVLMIAIPVGIVSVVSLPSLGIILSSMFSYFLLAPLILLYIPLYAFANWADVTWGTRPKSSEEEKEGNDPPTKGFRWWECKWEICETQAPPVPPPPAAAQGSEVDEENGPPVQTAAAEEECETQAPPSLAAAPPPPPAAAQGSEVDQENGPPAQTAAAEEECETQAPPSLAAAPPPPPAAAQGSEVDQENGPPAQTAAAEEEPRFLCGCSKKKPDPKKTPYPKKTPDPEKTPEEVEKEVKTLQKWSSVRMQSVCLMVMNAIVAFIGINLSEKTGLILVLVLVAPLIVQTICTLVYLTILFLQFLYGIFRGVYIRHLRKCCAPQPNQP